MKQQDLKGINLKLEVELFPQGDFIVANCPALQLSSYGDSEEDAKSAFAEALDIFIEDTMEKGTLLQVLKELGWSFKPDSRTPFIPPAFESQKQHVVQRYSITSIDFRVPASC